MHLRKILILAFLLVLPANVAMARIDILPRIVVLNDRERSAEITVLNLFNQPSLYRLSMIHYRQNPDGTYETLETPLSPDFDPETIVRLSPKQFQLTGGGRQKIRMSVRRPADLPEGEYRFHLLAKRFESADANNSDLNTEGAKINMKMNVAVAIPVIIRNGAINVQAAITDARYISPSESIDNRNEMSVTVNRQGTSSSIGELSIYQGDERIGYVSNFNVFPEITSRTIAVPLARDPRGQGQVRIVYTDLDDKVYDEQIIQP